MTHATAIASARRMAIGLGIAAIGALVVQQVISSTKFSISYLALVLFGLAVPRDTRLGWALSIFLVAGTLGSGALGFPAPPAWRASLDGGRWIGFLAGFILAVAWLRASREEPGPASQALS